MGANLALIAFFNGAFVFALLLAPFVDLGVNWLPLIVLSAIAYNLVRLWGSLAAMAISGRWRGEWIKLITLPLSGPFHVLFNISTTCIGLFRDFFGFGLHTNFAPESTLIRSGLTRVALAYRLRRALLLAVRAVLHGDVPFGAFWFGWNATPWTPNGFEGWTSGRRPPPVYRATPDRDEETSAFGDARELAPAVRD